MELSSKPNDKISETKDDEKISTDTQNLLKTKDKGSIKSKALTEESTLLGNNEYKRIKKSIQGLWICFIIVIILLMVSLGINFYYLSQMNNVLDSESCACVSMEKLNAIEALLGITEIPTNTPTETPSKTPSNAPSEAPTNIPTSVPTIAPSILTCHFEGRYLFGDNTTELYVCEQNNVLYIGIYNGVFVQRIARGSQINNISNGQIINVDELQLLVGQSPCYDIIPKAFSCLFDYPMTYQYDNITLQKISNFSDPQLCFQSSQSFDDLSDPILISGVPGKTGLTHLIGIPGNDPFTGCVRLDNGTSCDYSTLDGLFNNSVRVGCTIDCPQQQSSIFTPSNIFSIVCNVVYIFKLMMKNIHVSAY